MNLEAIFYITSLLIIIDIYNSNTVFTSMCRKAHLCEYRRLYILRGTLPSRIPLSHKWIDEPVFLEFVGVR